MEQRLNIEPVNKAAQDNAKIVLYIFVMKLVCNKKAFGLGYAPRYY